MSKEKELKAAKEILGDIIKERPYVINITELCDAYNTTNSCKAYKKYGCGGKDCIDKLISLKLTS